MKIEHILSGITARTYFECDTCGTEIYKCSNCDEYFEEIDDIYCCSDGKHICKQCEKGI